MSHSELHQINSSTSLNVVFSGTHGPIILFLHFWGGSSRTFSAITAILSPQYRTIAVDFRGWGSSTGPQDPDAYSITDLASDIEILIAKLNIKEFVLVGHSMGGKVAQLVAGRGLVQGLKGIILIGPAPPSPLVLPADMKEVQMTAYSTPESAEFVVRNVLSSSALSDDTVAILVEDIMKGNPFATRAWPVYAILEDVRAETRRIQMPVLVVAGELDKTEPMAGLQSEVVGNIAGAEMVVVRGSGHLLPVEAVSQVAQHIRSFVNKVIK